MDACFQMERKRAEAEASATAAAEAQLEEEDLRPSLQVAERELELLQERRAQAMAEVPRLSPPAARLRTRVLCLVGNAHLSRATGSASFVRMPWGRRG